MLNLNLLPLKVNRIIKGRTDGHTDAQNDTVSRFKQFPPSDRGRVTKSQVGLHERELNTYQKEFMDINFGVLVDVNFAENFMKLVL